MSRLARQPIAIPEGVTADFSDRVLSVKGPKGELSRSFRDEVTIALSPTEVALTLPKETLFTRALIGTYASHVTNMFRGVVEGFEKKLVIEGVGYKANVEGNTLVLSVGFSHQVKLPIPEGLSVAVEKNAITISGIDKEKVGLFASRIRKVRKPEPYKGKGIRYHDEVVRRKQGKKAVT